ncbi:methyl-accepting chemotaxis protein [Providencia huaxiensis]|uniref:Methyl-accepting chemotaxis protein n=1 Tax=Providencia huaxiensis TaxID=2027290 RepID=A0A345M1F5_9GAMM|nr:MULTISPECIES: PAS domain-containing methyl-accepting chemotaxis protein [Providencia]AXH64195.1 PAS domain-containing protein [Providencia huaxiensis]MBN6360449.1 PAS domain-containing protein [Providencia huaxiensis]MBQ0267808.1 PAS domain-containing protein [Providencia huaxiensis]MBQ0534369.1 PAS domain-containing protein [Providencia huaxiensis]MBQ0588922.1 PAS domain-containing protein [Providencia huaxiensis]
MSRTPYITQNEYVLDENITLMTTSDLQGNIVHANDFFVQVSGYELDELLTRPHNIIRHPDMPKEAFADMWATLKKGEPWTGIVKNRRKNGDHYWVRANIIPVERKGVITGYMSIRTRATRQEIATVEPLYTAMNENRSKRKIFKGIVLSKKIPFHFSICSTRWRIRLVMSLLFILWLIMASVVLQPIGSLLIMSICTFITLLVGNVIFEKMLATPLENITQQALGIARGNQHSVNHMQRTDEIGLVLRAIGQLGLVCRWLIKDVSEQVDNVRKGSESLVSDCGELETHTQQTVGYMQQTVATMNQMAVSVKMNADNTIQVDQLSNTTSETAVNGGAMMEAVVDTMNEIVNSTSKINSITDVIKDIAFQTNILALNAAVEAARAGEQGKGFAVVANEVRSLASRSASAVNDIRELINDCEKKVNSGKNQVNTAGDTMKEIVDQIQNVTQLITHISQATSEQAAGIADITQAVSELETITQQSTLLVEQSTETSNMVKARSSRLEDAVVVLH